VICANSLKKCCRSSDIVSKWGGDEFAIILPETSKKIVEEIVKRIVGEQSKNIKAKIITSNAIGSPIKNHIGQSIEYIIKKAEDNMYANCMNETDVVGRISDKE